jgi:hypothetical protein
MCWQVFHHQAAIMQNTRYQIIIDKTTLLTHLLKLWDRSLLLLAQQQYC